jgi:hypothetical protein
MHDLGAGGRASRAGRTSTSTGTTIQVLHRQPAAWPACPKTRQDAPWLKFHAPKPNLGRVWAVREARKGDRMWDDVEEEEVQPGGCMRGMRCRHTQDHQSAVKPRCAALMEPGTYVCASLGVPSRTSAVVVPKVLLAPRCRAAPWLARASSEHAVHAGARKRARRPQPPMRIRLQSEPCRRQSRIPPVCPLSYTPLRRVRYACSM